MLGLLWRIGLLALIFTAGFFDFLGVRDLHLARPGEFVWTLVFYAVLGGAVIVLIQRVILRRRARDPQVPRPWKRPGILGGADGKDPVHNVIYGGWTFAAFGLGTIAGVHAADNAAAIMVMSFWVFVGLVGMVDGWLCVRKYRDYYEKSPKERLDRGGA